MPAQKLREWPGTARQVTPAPGTFQARVFVFGFTALLTAGGTYGMYQVISPVNVTSLQLLFAAIFALTFTWISFACASACLGFWAILMGRTARSADFPARQDGPHGAAHAGLQ